MPTKNPATITPGPDADQASPPLVSLSSPIFKEVNVSLQALLGEMSMSVGDLLGLKAGAVVELQAGLNDLIELRLNQSIVARGEIVAVGDKFGVRIVEVAELK